MLSLLKEGNCSPLLGDSGPTENGTSSDTHGERAERSEYLSTAFNGP